MDKITVKKYSYENSKRIIEQMRKIDKTITAMRDDVPWGPSHEELVKAMNKALFETAEKTGMSLYRLCFTTVPEFYYIDPVIDYTNMAVSSEISYGVKFTPVLFELEKGGGYWKDKYYRLKEKMQALVDDKND